MKKKYIIDGFNLAFKIPSIAALVRSGQVEQAVRQVILFVRQNLQQSASEIRIVFDGRHGINANTDSTGNIKIIFSKKPQTADDVIRGFLHRTHEAKAWIVVSSDQQILNTAKDMGAMAMKSDLLGCKGKPNGSGKSANRSEKSNPMENDLDYWMDVFGETKSE